MSELTELMLKEKAACESRTPQLVELFVGRLGDNNAKVAALALQGMEKVPSIQDFTHSDSSKLQIPQQRTETQP